MNIVDIESHSIDLAALPEAPEVLDVGCRGFAFCKSLLKLRPFARITAMDPDPLLTLEEMPVGVLFLRAALVGDERLTSNYAGWSNGDGNLLCESAPWYAEREHTVPCLNITALMARLKVSYWDLVKLDCEESEFQILENWPGPIAGQLSVEFHDWTGEWRKKAKDDPAYYPRLFNGPLKDYEVLKHELSTVGPGPAWGHWDSVLRLRSLA